jgi:uncharacterized protein (UPF0548 family)
MFVLRKPSPEQIQTFISYQRKLPFSYSQVGATQDKPPAGFNLDHNRIRLGDGEQTYLRAVDAIKAWKQFDLGWVSIVPPNSPLEVGTTVAVQAKSFGLWSLNACRVVYLLDDNPEFKARFGFAYGTLPEHVERGEERFTIEWLEDGSVWYDIYAFSRPQHLLARLGFPLARRLQKRFAKESLATMMAAVMRTKLG